MPQEETAMTIHIKHLQKMKKMVIDSNIDLELTEIITETIDGCIENAQSHLVREKSQLRKTFNQVGKWASEITSEDYFNQEYTQISK